MSLKDLCTSFEEAKRRGSKRKRRLWSCRFCLFTCLSVAPCVVAFTLGLGVVVRHWRRSGELQPLLDSIADDQACAHEQTATCALKLTGEESNRFDLHPAENPLLGFIWQQVVLQNLAEMQEVLSGAHVIIPDPHGTSYAFLHSLPAAVRRTSSTHSSDRAQYDIPEGRVVASLLIGYLDNATWFQLEGAPWDLKNDFWRSLGHIFDTTEYVASFMKKNVGPLGTSRYTDQAPLLKSTVLPVSEACPSPCQSRPHYYAAAPAASSVEMREAPSQEPSRKQPALRLPSNLVSGKRRVTLHSIVASPESELDARRLSIFHA